MKAAAVQQSEFICSHKPMGSKKSAMVNVGDAHLMSCN